MVAIDKFDANGLIKYDLKYSLSFKRLIQNNINLDWQFVTTY
jgi:hypothetical protein